MFYTYILQSDKTGKYYVGSCSDLDNRLQRHNGGKNKSTKYGIPWKIIHLEVFSNRNDAYKREFQIKSYKGGQAFKKLVISK